MPPCRGWRRLFAPSGDDLGNPDPRIAQQSPKPISISSRPCARRRKQLVSNCTIRSRSIAPLCQGDDPQTGQDLVPYRTLPGLRRDRLAKRAGTTIIKPLRAKSPRSAGNPTYATAFVHSLARRRGPRGRPPQLRPWIPAFAGMTIIVGLARFFSNQRLTVGTPTAGDDRRDRENRCNGPRLAGR